MQVTVDLWLKVHPILSLERVAQTFNLSFETTCTAHNYARLNRAFNQLEHRFNTSTQRVEAHQMLILHNNIQTVMKKSYVQAVTKEAECHENGTPCHEVRIQIDVRMRR